MSQSRISIVLATYNGEKYLSPQIDSILNQSFSDFELIVCDDCSKDNTLGIIEEYAKKDSRVKLYKNETNLGFKKNFLKGLSLCSGEYVAFCDQDDVWLSNHLEVLYSNIKDNWYIGADATVVDSELKPLGKSMKDVALIEKLPSCALDYLYFEVNSNMFQGTASLGKRDFLLKYSNVPDVVSAHDHWFALAACMYGKATYVPEPVLLYRQHSNNIIGGKSMTKVQAIQDAFVRKLIKRRSYKNQKLSEYIGICKKLKKDFSDSVYIDDICKLEDFYKNRLKCRGFKALVFFIKNYEHLFLDYKNGKRYKSRKLNVLLP